MVYALLFGSVVAQRGTLDRYIFFFQGELDGYLDLAVGAETAVHYTNAHSPAGREITRLISLMLQL